jgi:DNA-binding NarL/FixJ family response regulator
MAAEMGRSTSETNGSASGIMQVLVVDDHLTFAELLTGAIDREPDLRCVGSAGSVYDAVQECLALKPDTVIMDFHLPDGTGLDAASAILRDLPETRIIILTGHPTPQALERSAEIGVCGFLPKDGSLAGMLETLRKARRGNMVVHPALLAQLGAARLNGGGHDVKVPHLTDREWDVLRLMAEGKDVRENAKILHISTSTCRGYVKAVLAKLNAHSQLEAVATARRIGLLTEARR